LCDDCEWPDEVDKKKEQKKLKKEQKKDCEVIRDNIDVKRAQMALARALARINLK
jgi:F-type H+-transporting ATPase subunit epsilon